MIHNYGKNKIPNAHFMNHAEFSGDCRLCNMDHCEGGEYFRQIIGRSWFQWDFHLYVLGMCHSTEILSGLLLATLVGSEYYYWSSSSLGEEKISSSDII
jgi:hypothetical protein